MFSHINLILGFLEEVKRLSNYPEITSSDTLSVQYGNIDVTYRNPLHSKKYDVRLFEGFSNSIRKLVILENEPISLKRIHFLAKNKISGHELDELNAVYFYINEYLDKNMNEVTQFSCSFDGSILERTSVFSLLNNFFAATTQHSKPEAQRKIDEINCLTYGALTEMIRIMMIDLKLLLEQYANILYTSL